MFKIKKEINFKTGNLFQNEKIDISSIKILSIKDSKIAYFYKESFLFEIVDFKSGKKIFSNNFSFLFKAEFDEKPSSFCRIRFYLQNNKIYFIYSCYIVSLDLDNYNNLSLIADFTKEKLSVTEVPISNNYLSVYNYENDSIKSFNIKDNIFINEICFEKKEEDIGNDCTHSYLFEYSPDGKYIISDSYDFVSIFDSKTGKCIKKIENRYEDFISIHISAKFTSDSKFLLIPINSEYTKDSICYIFDLEKMEIKYVLGDIFLKTDYKYKFSKLPYVISSTDPKSEFYIFDVNYEIEHLEISPNNKYAFYHVKERGTIIFEIETGNIIDLDIEYRYFFSVDEPNKFLMISNGFLGIEMSGKKDKSYLNDSDCILCELIE